MNTTKPCYNPKRENISYNDTDVVELLKLVLAANIDIIGHFAYSINFYAIKMNEVRYKQPFNAYKSSKLILTPANIENLT